jgi:hypothetical protein
MKIGALMNLQGDVQVQGPAVRTSAVRNFLTFLDDYSPGLQEAVRASLPNDVVNDIDRSRSLSWLELTKKSSVISALWETAGPKAALDAVADFIGLYVRSPFLSAYFEAPGATIPARLHAIALGWSLMYRDVCTVDLVSTSETSAHIRLTNMDPDVFASQEHLCTFAAVFLGLVRPTDANGEVRIFNTDSESASVDYAVSWGVARVHPEVAVA